MVTLCDSIYKFFDCVLYLKELTIICILFCRHSAEILSQDDIAVFSSPNTNLEIPLNQVNYLKLIIIHILVKTSNYCIW